MPEAKPYMSKGALILAALVATVIVGAVAVSGQIDGPDESCAQARTWHLRHALLHSEASDQEYHLRAAQAADDLGSGCSGWEQDAHGPSLDGDTSAQGLDTLQEQQKQAKAAQTT